MARSGRNCGCGSKDPGYTNSCYDNNEENTNLKDISCGDSGNSNTGGKCFFPTDIKKLLILLAEDDDDNRVDIVLDACSNHCFIEDARVIAVMDNTVILRDCDEFRYVCIGCICEVIVDCDDILDELFEQFSFNRE